MPEPILAKLMQIALDDPSSGALWGTESEDLDATLVAWPQGLGVAAHTNEEVDVLMVVLEGSARVHIDDADYQVDQGQLLLIPKGAHRRVEATSDRLVCLNVHKRRKKMGLGNLDTFRARSRP